MFHTLYVFGQVFSESFQQAFQQLWSNRLRTFLSLLGITIGIWCVIMVLSAVDSLEASIKSSFEELGNDVVYVNTMPWGEDPRENLWKYERRPEPSYNDFKAIKARLRSADIVAFNVFVGASNIEYAQSEASNVFIIGVTEDYSTMFNLEFGQGRYFSPTEFYRGTNHIIIGHAVAETLFGENANPLGKSIKVKGQRMQIVGVLKKEGKDLLNPIDYDDVAIIPYVTASKFLNINVSPTMKGRGSITVKAAKGVTLEQLKNDLTGVLRAQRKLKPAEENNFELNTLSILSNMMGNIFGIIRGAGLFIGIFAIFVGMFSVANIMFVSVKERTNLIGVKKALGAKRFVILMEFMIESVVLCLIGGAMGLFFVYLAALAATTIFEYHIFLSSSNIVVGLVIATITGVFAGIIPASMAARLDPVEAMRS